MRQIPKVLSMSVVNADNTVTTFVPAQALDDTRAALKAAEREIALLTSIIEDAETGRRVTGQELFEAFGNHGESWSDLPVKKTWNAAAERLNLRVQEPEPRQPWDVLREAADIVEMATGDNAVEQVAAIRVLERIADRLEAAQAENASVDELVEKAARVIHDSDEQGKFPPKEWEARPEALRNDYRANARALLAAGLLADGGDKA